MRPARFTKLLMVRMKGLAASGLSVVGVSGVSGAEEVMVGQKKSQARIVGRLAWRGLL